jgi:hypothetical protein
MISENKYLAHYVFDQLKKYAEFYDNLSASIMHFVTMGTLEVLNIDIYVYISIQGTLESIREILMYGRINDAYALLRKYYDAAIINIYTNLYLDDHFGIDNFVVGKIENWIKGIEQLPDIRCMNNYIQQSPKVKPIYRLLHKDKRYAELRNRCNDHTHYNFYQNILLNNNQLSPEKKIDFMDKFSNDLENILIFHLSYLFCIKEQYMMASDYIDCVECNITPEPNSQYWVAPFIQEIFNAVFKKSRMDLALEIMSNISMQLE